MVDLHKSFARQAAHRTRKIKLRQDAGAASDPVNEPDTTVDTAGGTIKIDDPKTCLIGFAVGMQISTDTFGACATTSID